MTSSINIEAFYQIFRDISKSVHSCSDVKEVLDLVVRKSTDVLNAKGALLRIVNLETSRLELIAAYGLSDRYLFKGHFSHKKIIPELYRGKKVIIIQDFPKDPRVQYPKVAEQEGFKMILDFPLTLEDNFIGVLRVFFLKERNFSEEELNFLVSIAEQCALAIDKARLIERHKSQYDHLAIQTEKMGALGRMSAAIAHEINNPLAGILLFSTNLLKKIPDEGPLKKGLDIIIHETLRCKNIIKALLEFSREKEPKKILANINEIIEKALCIIENEFSLHHISLVKELSDGMPDILIDTDQMEQVFVNLLLNAVEAIQENGFITIKSYMNMDRSHERIEISDTGCGIPQANMNRIFEPFFSTKQKGTGLGLPVTYSIIQGHQGNIEVSSQPGLGTRFIIDIPVAKTSLLEKLEVQDGAC